MPKFDMQVPASDSKLVHGVGLWISPDAAIAHESLCAGTLRLRGDVHVQNARLSDKLKRRDEEHRP